MCDLIEGNIVFLRCTARDNCVNISNVFPIFENFKLQPSEYIVERIVFKNLLLTMKRADFVVLVMCDHLKPKFSILVQCLKHAKTVITGNINDPLLDCYKEFPVCDLEGITSYVHANFNYDSLPGKVIKQKEKLRDQYANEIACPKRSTMVDSDVTLKDSEPEESQYTYIINISPIDDIYTHEFKDDGGCSHMEKSQLNKTEAITMTENYYVNSKYCAVVIIRCFLQDRCTWASNLHSTLEQHDFTTSEYVIEDKFRNLEPTSQVLKADFLVLVVCRHLENSLRKLKRTLQDFMEKIIITGDLNGLQTRQIFHGIHSFRIDEVEQIATHIKTFMSSKPKSCDEVSSPRYDDIKKDNYRSVQFNQSNPRFVLSSTCEPSENYNRGTLVCTKACFPKVVIRMDRLDNLIKRYYMVGDDERRDLVKQIINMTLKSLRVSSDYLGLIKLLGIADYHIQDNIINTLNKIQLEDNIMNRCLQLNNLLTAARSLLEIVRSNFGDSHIMNKLIPVTMDTISMLFLSTVTVTVLAEDTKEQIVSFCVEGEKYVEVVIKSSTKSSKDVLSCFLESLKVLLENFKSRVGHSKSLQIGNLKDALMVQDNRGRIMKHFQQTMCYLEQYTTLCLVANQVMTTASFDIVEFFEQLVRLLLQKSKRRPKLEEVLFSSLHLVTKAIVDILIKDAELRCIPEVVKIKLGKILNHFLNNKRLPEYSRSTLMSMIEPLIVSNSQLVIVNTVYLLRNSAMDTGQIRNKLITLVQNKLTSINMKVTHPSADWLDHNKPQWIVLRGKVFEDVDVDLTVLVPTLSCISKGDFDEYASKSNVQESKKHVNTLKILTSLNYDSTNHKLMQLYGFQCRPIPMFYVTEKAKSPDLQTYLLNSRANENKLGLQHLMNIALEIIEVILFLHKHHIVHRNLTCSAFSVRQSHKSVFLHDFSIAGSIRKGTGHISDMKLNDIPMLWSAPESIFEGRYDQRTDGWMLGNVLYEVFTCGRHPFTEVYNTPTEQKLEYVLFSDLKLYKWPCIPPEIHNIILSLTQRNPEDRSGVSEVKSKIEMLARNTEVDRNGESISVLFNEEENGYYPDVDQNQSYPERNMPTLIHQLRINNEMDTDQVGRTVPDYANTRISQRFDTNGVAVTPSDLTAIDSPRIVKRLGFMDVREPVTLKLLRILANIDEETYKHVLCLYESPRKHVTQTRGKLQSQNYSYYLKYKTERGNNILEIALKNDLGHPRDYTNRYINIVAKIVDFVYEMHKRHFVLGDLCAGNLYLAEKNEKIFMPRLGRMLYFDEIGGLEDCIVGTVFQDRRRWNPIEVLQHGQYSLESDIYRLAMSIYEVFTAIDIHSVDPMASHLRCSPFCYVENKDLLDTLYNGTVPPKPLLCPEWLYGIMLKCWDRDRTQRPSILWIKDIISRHTTNMSEDFVSSVFDQEIDTTVMEKEYPSPRLPVPLRNHHNSKEHVSENNRKFELETIHLEDIHGSHTYKLSNFNDSENFTFLPPSSTHAGFRQSEDDYQQEHIPSRSYNQQTSGQTLFAGTETLPTPDYANEDFDGSLSERDIPQPDYSECEYTDATTVSFNNHLHTEETSRYVFTRNQNVYTRSGRRSSLSLSPRKESHNYRRDSVGNIPSSESNFFTQTSGNHTLYTEQSKSCDGRIGDIQGLQVLNSLRQPSRIIKSDKVQNTIGFGNFVDELRYRMGQSLPNLGIKPQRNHNQKQDDEIEIAEDYSYIDAFYGDGVQV